MLQLLSYFFFIILKVTKYTNADKWYNENEVNFGQIGGLVVDQKSDSIVVFHRGSHSWKPE